MVMKKRSPKRSPKRSSTIQSSLKFNVKIPFINYYMEEIIKDNYLYNKYKIEFNKLFEMQQNMNKCIPSILDINSSEQIIKTYLNNNDSNNCEQVNCMIHNTLNTIAQIKTNNVSKYGENLCIPSLLNYNIFQEIFKPFKIGDGAYGMVFKLSYYSIPNVFIIKVPLKSSIKEQETMHESLICSYLNRLRTQTNGFSYSFNGFQCGISNDAKDLCKSKNPRNVSYISIYEYVSDTTFRKFINNTNNIKDIFHIILIVLNNLRIAQEDFKFVHCDLHLDNILIRKLQIDKDVTIGNYIFKCKYEPVIIDFGMSTITITEDNIETDLNRGSYVYNQKLYLKTFDIYRLISDLVHIVDRKRDKNSNRFFKYESDLLSYFWNNTSTLELKKKLENDRNRTTQYSNFYKDYSMMKTFSLGSIEDYITILTNFIKNKF